MLDLSNMTDKMKSQMIFLRVFKSDPRELYELKHLINNVNSIKYLMTCEV